ncbi:hypothetical protein ACS3SW_15580 [Roseobacteraceae bacterium S113]
MYFRLIRSQFIYEYPQSFKRDFAHFQERTVAVDALEPQRTSVVAIDENWHRSGRLVAALEHDDRFGRAKQFKHMNEAFTDIEASQPEFVIVSHRYSKCAEFPMLRGLLAMLGVPYFTLGDPESDPSNNLRRQDDLALFLEVLARRMALPSKKLCLLVKMKEDGRKRIQLKPRQQLAPV